MIAGQKVKDPVVASPGIEHIVLRTLHGDRLTENPCFADAMALRNHLAQNGLPAAVQVQDPDTEVVVSADGNQDFRNPVAGKIVHGHQVFIPLRPGFPVQDRPAFQRALHHHHQFLSAPPSLDGHNLTGDVYAQIFARIAFRSGDIGKAGFQPFDKGFRCMGHPGGPHARSKPEGCQYHLQVHCVMWLSVALRRSGWHKPAG